MTALVEDNKRKLEVPKSHTHLWNQWKQIILPATPDGREGTSPFLSVEGET